MSRAEPKSILLEERVIWLGTPKVYPVGPTGRTSVRQGTFSSSAQSCFSRSHPFPRNTRVFDSYLMEESWKQDGLLQPCCVPGFQVTMRVV